MHVAKAWKSVSGCGLVGVVLVGVGSESTATSTCMWPRPGSQ